MAIGQTNMFGQQPLALIDRRETEGIAFSGNNEPAPSPSRNQTGQPESVSDPDQGDWTSQIGLSSPGLQTSLAGQGRNSTRQRGKRANGPDLVGAQRMTQRTQGKMPGPMADFIAPERTGHREANGLGQWEEFAFEIAADGRQGRRKAGEREGLQMLQRCACLLLPGKPCLFGAEVPE